MRSNALSVFSVLLFGLICNANVRAGVDAHTLTRQGSQMSSEDAVALEQQVEKNPDDVDSRTKLLGYYFIKGRRDPNAKSARLAHIVWLIENAPESEVLGLPYGNLDRFLEFDGYNRAKQAWMKVVEKSPENLSSLRNAAKFFLLQDRKLSEELLLKGQTLDANDPAWPAALGQLYSLGLMALPAGPERSAAAMKAFQQYKKAYDLSTAEEVDGMVISLAKTALAAGLKDEAKEFATKMLDDHSESWNLGNRIHHGNLILGQIALTEGNVDEAKSRLLLAGKTSGSPQLNSFGPNMQLAKELIERGETDVVLQYFELCKNFWKSPNRQLEAWTDDVKSNRAPKFGANLAY